MSSNSQVARQEIRRGLQVGFLTSPQPLESTKGRVSEPQGALPLEMLPMPLCSRQEAGHQTLQPGPAVSTAPGSSFKSAAPPDNQDGGWGAGGKLQSCSCNML